MAIQGPGSGSNADGYFKEIYADQLENLVPEHSVLAQAIPFREKEKLGDSYHMPVRVRRAQGVTFAGPTESMSAFSLNDVVSGKMLDAQVAGSTFVGRESFAYKAVVSATSKGKQAFGDLFDDGVKDLLTSASFYRELSLLYGGGNIGVFGAGGASSTANQDIVLTAATSAIGVWAQMEGAYIDVYSADLSGKRNPVGTITVEGATESAGVVTLTLKGSVGSEMANIIATDVAIPRGAKGEWFSGLEAICSNAGTLFNIDADKYPLWRANELAVGGALTMAKVQKAAAMIVPRAGLGELTCYVSVSTWANLNNDIVGMRQFDEAGGVAELGAQSIRYHGPSGIINIIAHPMLKGGISLLGDPKAALRVGATDLTFNLDGVDGSQPKFLRELVDKAGFEVRCLWDQALLLKRPAGWTYLTGIVNT